MSEVEQIVKKCIREKELAPRGQQYPQAWIYKTRDCIMEKTDFTKEKTNEIMCEFYLKKGVISLDIGEPIGWRPDDYMLRCGKYGPYTTIRDKKWKKNE